MNFFWNGHASNVGISSSASDSDGLANLASGDVAGGLHNARTSKGWQQRQHPYRLVILNGCETAEDDLWARAFGIEGTINTKAKFQRKGESPQAFVGWTGTIDVPAATYLNILPPTTFDAYAESLAILFSEWMADVPLGHVNK